MRRTYRWCRERGRVVPAGMEAGARRGDNGGPSLLATPMVWGVMPETRNVIDNRVYDSREKFYATGKAAGAIDIGKNEARRHYERNLNREPRFDGPSVDQSIKQALQKEGFL